MLLIGTEEVANLLPRFVRLAEKRDAACFKIQTIRETQIFEFAFFDPTGVGIDRISDEFEQAWAIGIKLAMGHSHVGHFIQSQKMVVFK